MPMVAMVSSFMAATALAGLLLDMAVDFRWWMGNGWLMQKVLLLLMLQVDVACMLS